MKQTARVLIVISLWVTFQRGFTLNIFTLPPRIYDLHKAKQYFKKYLKNHNKYYNERYEYDQRLSNFIMTLKRINKYNSEPQQKQLILNKYADLNDEERSFVDVERTNKYTFKDKYEKPQFNLDSSMNIKRFQIK